MTAGNVIEPSNSIIGAIIGGSIGNARFLVGVAGFEPATPASRTQCSTGLSHTPTKNAAYSRGCRRPQATELRKLIPVNVGLKTLFLPAGAAATAAAARALADGAL